MRQPRPLLYALLNVGLSSIIFFSCDNAHNATNSNQKAFTILQATKEVWYHGRPGGSSGVDYRLTAVIHTDKNLTFDSLWIAEHSQTLAVEPVRLKGPVTAAPFRFAKGDTIGLFATSSLLNTSATPLQATTEAARLWFRLNGKQFYQTVPAIQQLQTDPRPQQPQ